MVAVEAFEVSRRALVCMCLIDSTIKILMVESSRHTHICVMKIFNIKLM